jgi:RNA polymerase sigma-70 factor, ECF subfamily
MNRMGSRHSLRWFLCKAQPKDEHLPSAVRIGESSPLLAQRTVQETEGERELMRRSCAGDQEAFAVLVRTHQRRAFLLAFGMLNNAEEACEVVQEAFLAAWQGLHTVREEARFSPWFARVVYQGCLRTLEQRRRAIRDLEAAPAPDKQRGDLEASQELQSLVTARERQQTIQQAIQELPGKYRAVLILRHLQHRTYEEIAQVLNLPVGTTKTQVFRARHLGSERLQVLDHNASAPAPAASSPASPCSSVSDGPSPALLAHLMPSWLRFGSAGKTGRRSES